MKTKNNQTIYMKMNEDGVYIVDENSRRSLKQDLLERFSEDRTLREIINNVFDFPDWATESPEDLANFLLSKNMKDVTPR